MLLLYNSHLITIATNNTFFKRFLGVIKASKWFIYWALSRMRNYSNVFLFGRLTSGIAQHG